MLVHRGRRQDPSSMTLSWDDSRLDVLNPCVCFVSRADLGLIEDIRSTSQFGIFAMFRAANNDSFCFTLDEGRLFTKYTC
jgi:hypothetical protein